MSRSKTIAAAAVEPIEDAPGWAERLLPALVAALFFARFWIPTEGTVLGDSLWIAGGWLIAAVVAGWTLCRGGKWNCPGDAWTWSALALVGGHALSAGVVLLTTGQKRAACTEFWEWISIGVGFCLLRHVLSHFGARKEWTLLLLATGVTLSGYGVYQSRFVYPQLRSAYDEVRVRLDELEQAPPPSGYTEQVARQQEMLALRQKLVDLGVSPHMQTGSGRAMFEGRLRYSSEPIACFALANTLAGVLLVVWTLLFGQLLDRTRPVSGPWRLPPLWLVLALALVGLCLVLTKSRTAFLALMLACVSLLGLRARRLGWRWRHVVYGLAGLLVLSAAVGVIAVSTGGWDRLVLLEAPKSLKYRLEYWWSSLWVILDSPVWGVGPGQFRAHYLKYKLPASSEEIADPHNLFLDVWANGGLLALAGLLALLWLAWRTWRPNWRAYRSTARIRNSAERISLPPQFPHSVRKWLQPGQTRSRKARRGPGSDVDAPGWRNPVRWGGLAGGLLVWCASWGFDSRPLILSGCVAALIAISDRWLTVPTILRATWIAALFGLTIHLLGAGGIGMPAITQLLLLCCLLAETPAEENKVGPAWRWSALGGALVVCGMGWGWGWYPATQSRLLWELADVLHQPQKRIHLYHQAAAIDSWSPEPWENLATLEMEIWLQSGAREPDHFQQGIRLQKAALQRDPLNFQPYRVLGEFYLLQAKRATGPATQQAAEAAVHWLRQAVERYPHHAEQLFLLAEAEQLADDPRASATAAATLQQDAINRAARHYDKFLSDEQVQKLSDWARSQSSP